MPFASSRQGVTECLRVFFGEKFKKVVLPINLISALGV